MCKEAKMKELLSRTIVKCVSREFEQHRKDIYNRDAAGCGEHPLDMLESNFQMTHCRLSEITKEDKYRRIISSSSRLGNDTGIDDTFGDLKIKSPVENNEKNLLQAMKG